MGFFILIKQWYHVHAISIIRKLNMENKSSQHSSIKHILGCIKSAITFDICLAVT